MKEITTPVTRSEVMNIFFREVYSAKDLLNEQTIREMLTKVGVDYDEARSKAESLTDSEILEMLKA
jgi:ribosomal protein L12E/L44/L45/RPP1/RPP2